MTKNLLSASLVAVASLAASGNAQAQDLRMLNPLNWFGGSSYNTGYANCANGQCFPQTNGQYGANYGVLPGGCVNGYCPPNSGYGYNAYRPNYGTVPVTQYRNTYPTTYPTNYRTLPAYQGTPNYQTLPYTPSPNYYPSGYSQPVSNNSPFFR
jgi:hypothetical protein